MRIIELFAGIGACSKALKRIGVDLEIIDAVEIDKYAMVSFNAIHGTNFESQDITEWNKDFKDIDIITHGSPCQDFSVAGKQAGGDLGSGTRSSLMYETIRIVGQVRPKYVLWENVKNILSKKHIHNFNNYIEAIDKLGYNSYYQVLNAKDYGIPQNRERVYTISIRKDVDNGNFQFPEKEELKLRLKDILEDEVDEKYYINDGILNNISSNNQAGFLSGGKWDKINESCRRYYKEEGISPTVHTCQGGNTEPKILEEDIINPLKGISGKSWQFEQNVYANESKCLRSIKAGGGSGNIPKIITYNVPQTVKEGLSPTLTQQEEKIYERTPLKFLNRNQKNINGDYAFCVDSSNTGGIKEIENNNYRIRKLTPKECWRLMGFADEDFEKAQNIPTSNTQLYKMAGNSIVVNVLEKIFKNLFKED